MSASAQDLLNELRQRARERLTQQKASRRTFGDSAADFVAATVGSWRFILVQTALLIAWIVFNAASGRPVDPYPFILLNLMLSFQAAYTAPIIMMSQNRQGERDRMQALEDYRTNQEAKLEIEALQIQLNKIETEKLDKIIKMLEDMKSR